MTVHLFQDVAGTIPAVLAGQPVGFIKRTKGSDDAKQATALSKPTLARHSKGGIKNLATGINNYTEGGYWIGTGMISGVTRVKVGVFTEGDFNFVRYALSGTCQADGLISVSTAGPTDVYGVLLGEQYISSAYMRIHSGAEKLNTVTEGLRVDLSERTGVTNNGNATADRSINTDWRLFEVRRSVSNPASTLIRSQFGLRLDTGTVADGIMFDVAYPQVERGTARTSLQYNLGPNDIFEPGIPDLWHLYNDGGDSLNVTLPAGTYGLASIGIDRQIVVTTLVSDGTTPVNILRHERQLDVCYRLGAYSAAEELAIRDAWGRKYA